MDKQDSKGGCMAVGVILFLFLFAAGVVGVYIYSAANEESNSTSESQNESEDDSEQDVTQEVPETVETRDTLKDVLAKDSELQVFYNQLVFSGLTEMIDNIDEEYTVFAPHSDVFAALTLESGKDAAEKFARSFIFKGKLKSEALLNLQETEIENLNGDKFKIQIIDGAIFLGNAELLELDLIARNGIVHVAGGVL